MPTFASQKASARLNFSRVRKLRAASIETSCSQNTHHAPRYRHLRRSVHFGLAHHLLRQRIPENDHNSRHLGLAAAARAHRADQCALRVRHLADDHVGLARARGLGVRRVGATGDDGPVPRSRRRLPGGAEYARARVDPLPGRHLAVARRARQLGQPQDQGPRRRRRRDRVLAGERRRGHHHPVVAAAADGRAAGVRRADAVRQRRLLGRPRLGVVEATRQPSAAATSSSSAATTATATASRIRCASALAVV